MVRVKGERVEFRFFRPHARSVCLAGDFNGWRWNEMWMSHQPDGYWAIGLTLRPGVYKFRYCADGECFTDYAAFGIEMGPFGWDSVVRVAVSPPAPRRRPAAPQWFAVRGAAQEAPAFAADSPHPPPAPVGRGQSTLAAPAR